MVHIAFGTDSLWVVGIMSKKTSEARKRAFFTALAETGNQTISAERARVSRSWVSLHRSTDPAFKARMESAIAEARARLSRAGAVTSSGKWANINGEKLVVRGSGGRGGGRRVQVSRARLKQWTAAEEGRFLTVLAATCNVKLACRAVGLSVASAHGHRHRWPDFARNWDAAIQDGYITLEMALIENACISLSDPSSGEFERAAVPALPIETMTVDGAIRLLGLHRRTATGVGNYPGGRILEATEEQTYKTIRKWLDRFERTREKRGGAI